VTDRRLFGRVALVTGAGSGIGRATAIRLAAEGAGVACADVKGASETAAAIRVGGGEAIAADVDVTDFAIVQTAVDEAIATFGGIDIVCNIAGIGHFAWSHEESPEAFDEVIQVNLNGTFHVCRAALPTLLERKGVIINTASNTGLMGAPWSAAYCASKGGVVQLTRALAREYNSHGLRVNAIAPGGTNTNIIEQFSIFPDGADVNELYRLISPFGSAEPDDIAAAYAFVASDEARFMTGSIIPVDGGLTA
jgi:meso-butanediol dehydrogenase/(S,S)-butanediol dehydrogenase/diacetyl reductase